MLAAFAVASLEAAELRLKHFNIEYHKFLVPGTNAAQIFLYDPEGCVAEGVLSVLERNSTKQGMWPIAGWCCRNGIEMGEGYDEIAASLVKKQP